MHTDHNFTTAGSDGRGTRRARRRDQRGAAAVEAGIVSVLVFMLFFGIVEFGLLWRNINVISNSARQGATLASQLTRDADYHTLTVDRIERALDGLPRGNTTQITIFEADPTTAKPISGDSVDACTSDCYRFERRPNGTWAVVPGTGWLADDMETCDYIGVTVTGNYEWITWFFGADRSITETSVKRLEPAPGEVNCPTAVPPPVEPTPTPPPTPTPTPTPIPPPTATPTPAPPTPTATAVPPTPTSTATPDPSWTPTPTPVPPTPTPTPIIVPTATPDPGGGGGPATPTPTATPTPGAPTPTPTPSAPTPTPTPAPPTPTATPAPPTPTPTPTFPPVPTVGT